MNRLRLLEITASVALVFSLASVAGMAYYRHSLNTALVRALDQRDLSHIRALIRRGAEVNLREQGRTALTIAAGANDLELVVELLARGADPDGGDPADLPPVMCADNPQVIQRLLNAGADVNGHRGDGSTALMGHAAVGNSCAVEILLDYGADVARRDTDGGTALEYAVLAGDKESARLIRQRLSSQ